MNTILIRNNTLFILTLIGILSFGGCSQKSSNEDVAAQVKVALAEEKAKEQAQSPVPMLNTAAPITSAKTKAVPPAKPAQEKSVQAKQIVPVEKSVCANCGSVVSVTEIEQEGKGSGLGAIAGGVAGGLAGNQVGQGTGRDLATIAGVVGGAFAGNKIEKTVKKTKVYDVVVKMEDGEQQVLRQDTAPSVISGDKVKIEDGHIIKQ